MAEVHGFCDERFAALGAQLRANLESGLDEGAALAVSYQGEFVVDLWGGTRDRARSLPWERDTLVRVYSSSKVMVILSILLLADRGLIDLDAPIATYWPEFARHGKGAVTVRQVLTHRSGTPGFDATIPFEQLGDWERTIQVIEDAELWFEPGTVTCYSPQAFGFQLGEVVRRVSGQSLPEFFRVEFADPLGVDFHFSISDPATLDRVADQWPDLEEELPTGMAERLMAEVVTSGQWVSRRFVSTVAPAASGLSNGRALARVGAMLAMGGELGGRRYLSRSILDEASSEQTLSEDLALGPIRYGLGFGLDSDSLRASTPTSFHWGGYGGSFITMDMATGISAGFSPNRLRVADSFAPEGRLSTLWKLLGDAVRNLA